MSCARLTCACLCWQSFSVGLPWRRLAAGWSSAFAHWLGLNTEPVRKVAKIEKQDLLIIDDFGIQPLDQQSRTILMEIIEDRHGKKSTLLTSQVPVNHWHGVIRAQTIADAILDRTVHDANRLEIMGESMRKKSILTEEMTEYEN